jgi:hypothetical protein
MARLKVWREVVRDALKGGVVRDNAQMYKRVAKRIGAKELTPNQKAKVRQQLQLVGEKPGKQKRSNKRVAGKWKLKVKLPKANEIDSILNVVGYTPGSFHEKESGFFKTHKVFVFEYQIPEDTGEEWITHLPIYADLLTRHYGDVDTSIDFKVVVISDEDEPYNQWYNLAFAKSPTIAAEQAPHAKQEYGKKTADVYKQVIEKAVAFSFTLYIPV